MRGSCERTLPPRSHICVRPWAGALPLPPFEDGEPAAGPRISLALLYLGTGRERGWADPVVAPPSRSGLGGSAAWGSVARGSCGRTLPPPRSHIPTRPAMGGCTATPTTRRWGATAAGPRISLALLYLGTGRERGWADPVVAPPSRSGLGGSAAWGSVVRGSCERTLRPHAPTSVPAQPWAGAPPLPPLGDGPPPLPHPYPPSHGRVHRHSHHSAMAAPTLPHLYPRDSPSPEPRGGAGSFSPSPSFCLRFVP